MKIMITINLEELYSLILNIVGKIKILEGYLFVILKYLSLNIMKECESKFKFDRINEIFQIRV